MTHTTLSLGLVKSGVQVQQLTTRFQHLKSMGKTLRDNHHVYMMRRKLLGMPLFVAWGVRTQIHRNVPNSAAQAANQLHLTVGRNLKMKASDCAKSAGERMVDLDYLAATDQIDQFVSTE
jgi:hypothetical protein